jgi:hypothetical protein
LRIRLFTEARGFTDRAETVLLPGLIWLPDCWRRELLKLGDGCLAVADTGDLLLRTLDGVLRGLILVGRLTGVCDESVD